MKKLLLIFTLLISFVMNAETISSVETQGSWVYLYNAQGRRYKTLSVSSTGTVLGYSSEFFVTQNGSWIYLYDADGRKYKTLSASSVGTVTGVAGNTFTSRNGNWIYTWDRDGKKINTRSGH